MSGERCVPGQSDSRAGFEESLHWQLRQIRPVDSAVVSRLSTKQYHEVLGSKHLNNWKYDRGGKILLVPGVEFTELPGWDDKTAREVIAELPADSKMLSVGCGKARLAEDIRVGINPDIKIYGFDGKVFREQIYRLDGMVQGNILSLNRAKLSDLIGVEEFDLVETSTVLMHLPDYWRAVARMYRLLKQGGLLLASSMPRAGVYGGGGKFKSAEDVLGNLLDGDWGRSYEYCSKDFDGWRVGTVFNAWGQVMGSGEVTRALTASTGVDLQYSVASAGDGLTDKVGARVAVKNEGKELDMSQMFYCRWGSNSQLGRQRRGLGYVLAQSEIEKKQLVERGFVSVQDLLK